MKNNNKINPVFITPDEEETKEFKPNCAECLVPMLWINGRYVCSRCGSEIEADRTASKEGLVNKFKSEPILAHKANRKAKTDLQGVYDKDGKIIIEDTDMRTGQRRYP